MFAITLTVELELESLEAAERLAERARQIASLAYLPGQPQPPLVPFTASARELPDDDYWTRQADAAWRERNEVDT